MIKLNLNDFNYFKYIKIFYKNNIKKLIIYRDVQIQI